MGFDWNWFFGCWIQHMSNTFCNMLLCDWEILQWMNWRHNWIDLWMFAIFRIKMKRHKYHWICCYSTFKLPKFSFQLIHAHKISPETITKIIIILIYIDLYLCFIPFHFVSGECFWILQFAHRISIEYLIWWFETRALEVSFDGKSLLIK